MGHLGQLLPEFNWLAHLGRAVLIGVAWLAFGGVLAAILGPLLRRARQATRPWLG